MQRREAGVPHLRIAETVMHLRRTSKEARYPAKLHPDSRAHACMAVPNRPGDSGSSIEKFTCSKRTGAKVCSSPDSILGLPWKFHVLCAPCRIVEMSTKLWGYGLSLID